MDETVKSAAADYDVNVCVLVSVTASCVLSVRASQALCCVLSHRDNVLRLPCIVCSSDIISLTCPPCLHHTAAPLQSIESAEDLQHFRSALIAKFYLSTVHCDLGKVQRIASQSMLLINHVSE